MYVDGECLICCLEFVGVYFWSDRANGGLARTAPSGAFGGNAQPPAAQPVRSLHPPLKHFLKQGTAVLLTDPTEKMTMNKIGCAKMRGSRARTTTITAATHCSGLCNEHSLSPVHSSPAQFSRSETLEGSFSAVSTPMFATKYSFCSIFRDLQDLHSFALLRIQKFRKSSSNDLQFLLLIL